MEFDDPRAVQWIEIDGNSLIHNLELFRKTIDEDASLLAVVKANAYGHGLAEVVPRGELQRLLNGSESTRRRRPAKSGDWG